MSATTRVELRVVPGRAADGVVGRLGGRWKVRVAAPPERGRANDALVRLLAETLGLAPSDVSIVRGQGARDKVVTLVGIGPQETERRLAQASAAPAGATA